MYPKGLTLNTLLARISRQFHSTPVEPHRAGTKRVSRQPATGLAIALEPRYLFDGAGVATAIEAVHDQPPDSTSAADPALDALAQALASRTVPANGGTDGAYSDTGSSAPPPAAAGAPPSPPQTDVVIIDSRVKDAGTLIARVDPSAKVYVLDAARDAVEQITDILSQYQNLDAVHLLSHGGEGFIDLGGQTLSSDTLPSYREALGAWGGALAAQGDLLLYGCYVSANGGGQSFLADIAAATGADVAGSDNVTGRGGDWTLETATGPIETAALSVPDYSDQLAVTGITPSAHALNVAASGNIVLTFGTATTLTKDTDFFVRGSLSGQINGTLTGNGTTTVTFDPTTDFKPGEVVTVEVTAAAGGPTIYRYTVATASADLLFHDSGQTLSTQKTQVVALGDLDGDGDLDMVQGNPGDQNIKVWLNNGSGSFTDNGQTLTLSLIHISQGIDR